MGEVVRKRDRCLTNIGSIFLCPRGYIAGQSLYRRNARNISTSRSLYREGSLRILPSSKAYTDGEISEFFFYLTILRPIRSYAASLWRSAAASNIFSRDFKIDFCGRSQRFSTNRQQHEEPHIDTVTNAISKIIDQYSDSTRWNWNTHCILNLITSFCIVLHDAIAARHHSVESDNDYTAFLEPQRTRWKQGGQPSGNCLRSQAFSYCCRHAQASPAFIIRSQTYMFLFFFKHVFYFLKTYLWKKNKRNGFMVSGNLRH